jgi:NAD-dependent SIR2 family protein deacetylase
VLTGAGVSTGSGIPDYRDAAGKWKRPHPPVSYAEFLRHARVRRLYWARSLVGWPHFIRAQPGPAHQALDRLESAGHVHQLVTQNVDGLHQRAGSRRVIDLHGRLDAVDCQACGARYARTLVQDHLIGLNPHYERIAATLAPDGHAEVDETQIGGFRIPECKNCGGVLKPSVVFFGENVPSPRVARAVARLRECDAMLVVGSSLMVYSGFRFCRTAAELGKPIAAINLGRSRADALFSLKLEMDCGPALHRLAAHTARREQLVAVGE